MRLTHYLAFAAMASAAPVDSDRKSLAVTGGYTYSYHFSSAKGSNPTFLLLHGFPSSSYDWRKQIPLLRDAGYGIIAPDLLGYGETSKPAAVGEYALSKISGHVAEILKHEKVTSVIGVGHDL